MSTEIQPIEGVQEALVEVEPIAAHDEAPAESPQVSPTVAPDEAAEWAARVNALPKRQQGAEIDTEIDALIGVGIQKTDAIAQVAGLLGMKPATVSVGYYRRHREPQAAPAPAAEANGHAEVSQLAQQIEAMIEREVGRRVKERMAAVRAALGS